MAGSEPRRNAEGAPLVGIVLRPEFLGPEDMGIGQPDRPDDKGYTALNIANQRLFVDAVAVAESIAIEKNTVEHAPPLGTKEDIPTETAVRDEVIGTGQAGPDPRRAVIVMT